MIRFAHDLLKPLAISAVAAAIATCHGGCTPKPAGDPQAAAQAYKAAQLACVSKAKTLEESKACRAKVNGVFKVCEGQWPRYVPCGSGQ